MLEPFFNVGCTGYDTDLCGGLNMDVVWTTFFWLIPIWTFLLIPFSTFYYEADDGLLLNPGGDKKSRIRPAITYTLAVVIIITILYAIAYLTTSEAEIPVQAYSAKTIAQGVNEQNTAQTRIIFTSNAGERGINFTINLLEDMGDGDALYVAGQIDLGEQKITLKVSVSTFFAGLMAWLGWFLFAIFGGIGMSALPLDLILAFKNRPRKMDAGEFAEAQTSLRARVNELVSIGEMIKVEQDGKTLTTESKNPFNKEKRKERTAMNEFKQAVFLLEQDVEDFQACTSEYENTNPLVPYISLVAGFFSMIISIFWILHIIVYVLPGTPWASFLNAYFTWFDGWFPLFGVLSVAIFTLYMLFAAIKGCFKFGMRCGCIQLHPMIYGKTYMSSFLFNIGLVLLCALPVVQFCATSFSGYARNSNIFQIFGVQIENLKFFGFFWKNNVFTYIFLVITLLSAVYLWCKPKDGPPSSDDLRDRLRSRTA
jgi:LMBR1 domain-containing protein 1